MTVIVVPVFNALAETRRCLKALEATIGRNQPVIVIDDASTDPEMADLIAQQPARWTKIKNEENLGFVASANFGMTLAGGRDVILLNADTQVAAGWLDAIERCAASNERIASITPLTNNGEIASIPEFCRANPWPENISAWAQACRLAGPPEYTPVPTGVGFCMFMRRAAIAQVGLFDEQAFGRGYGEENDWCMRASGAGWTHVLCDDAFVAHQGGASFGPLGEKPGGQAMETLLKRHPDYMQRVQAFISADPMAARREKIIAAHNRLTGRAV